MNGISSGGGAKPAPNLPTDHRQGAVAAKGPDGRRNRADVHPQILAAAEGMEAMFVDYMMKTMRQSVEKSEMSLDNSATEIYQGMLDTEIAQKSVRTNSLGLADQIIAYLESRSYNTSQGSTNEGGSPVKHPATPKSEPAITHQEIGRETGEIAVQEVHHAGK